MRVFDIPVSYSIDSGSKPIFSKGRVIGHKEVSFDGFSEHSLHRNYLLKYGYSSQSYNCVRTSNELVNKFFIDFDSSKWLGNVPNSMEEYLIKLRRNEKIESIL
jgi:hypothetical protein